MRQIGVAEVLGELLLLNWAVRAARGGSPRGRLKLERKTLPS
jgi:hypothetical protein